MLKLTQEGEIRGSQVEKNKEVGHHRSIKKIETSQGTRDHMIGGTEKTTQKMECIEILVKVTEMQRQKNRCTTNKVNLARICNIHDQQQ